MEYFDRGVLRRDVLKRIEQKIHREVYKSSKSKPKLSKLQNIITRKVSIQNLIPIYLSSLRKKQTNFTEFLKADASRRANVIKSVLIAKKEVNRMIQYAKKQIKVLSTRKDGLEKGFGSLKSVSSRSLRLSKTITSLRRLLKTPKVLNKLLMNKQTKLINTRNKEIEDCESDKVERSRKLNEIDEEILSVKDLQETTLEERTSDEITRVMKTSGMVIDTTRKMV